MLVRQLRVTESGLQAYSFSVFELINSEYLNHITGVSHEEKESLRCFDLFVPTEFEYVCPKSDVRRTQ